MTRFTIGDFLMWLGLAIIVIWIVLKVSGVIDSYEFALVIGVAIAFGGMIEKISFISSEVRNIRRAIVKLGHDFRELKGEHEAITKGKRH